MASCYDSWLRLCSKFHAVIGRLFVRWSHFVYRRPLIVMVTSLLISFGLMAGFMRYNVYGQAERLFYPQNSEEYKALDRAEKHFNYYIQNEEFIFVSERGRNILTQETMDMVYATHKGLMQIPGFDEFCVVMPMTNNCTVIGPFEVFNGEDFSNSSQKIFSLLTNNDVMSNSLIARRKFSMMFGNFVVNMTSSQIHAEVIRVAYPVHFAKTRKEYERNSKWERQMKTYLENLKKSLRDNHLEISYNTVRGLDDSISQNTKDNFKLIVFSIGSMIVFCVVAMVNLKDRVKSHVLIGFVGIVTVMFGIGAGIGLGLLIGQPYVGFIGVLPFLVLGIGIDDMFIIVSYLDRVDSKIQGEERLSEAMQKAGFSILMTTLTDLVAFIVGTGSVFPAIRIFCVFAFLSILFTFLLIVSFFLAALTYDMKRQERNRLDCVPCCVNKSAGDVEDLNKEEKQENSYSYKIMFTYATFLVKPLVKCIFLCFGGILLAFGVYGTINTSLEFDTKMSGASSSPYINWLTVLESYFPFGVMQMDVVLNDKGIDYGSEKVQQQFKQLNLIASKVPELNQNVTINWMSGYIEFCRQSNLSSTQNFTGNLQAFLTRRKDFLTDVRLNSRGDVIASRVHFFTKNKMSLQFRKEALLNLRDSLKAIDLPFYPVSFNFIYLSHMVVIVKATLSNVAICATVVLLLTLPFVKCPTASLLVLFSFVCFMMELLAVMYVWDLTLNSVTMIVIIMAIGFTVDYNCHVTHGYISSRKDTPNLRLIDSMTALGSSVLKGGLSTLIGVLVLGFSGSKLFRLFFKMMFSIITLGLLHGMVILPVLLTLLLRSNASVVSTPDQFHRNGDARESKKGLLKSSNQTPSDGPVSDNNVSSL